MRPGRHATDDHGGVGAGGDDARRGDGGGVVAVRRRRRQRRGEQRAGVARGAAAAEGEEVAAVARGGDGQGHVVAALGLELVVESGHVAGGVGRAEVVAADVARVLEVGREADHGRVQPHVSSLALKKATQRDIYYNNTKGRKRRTQLKVNKKQ